ncbi:twitching motility protein PilT [Herbaspirillum sp. Sphag1AN]|uniref:type IV pilus twitching motility protein PilT n=1 Tax=unclassified Herbaspirillum TaxID=2624150 RepID=UPI0016087C24|nr:MULTISPECIES: type IV pilus twitching motility protein PilT [unclassified Herbaspirillum]MBB3214569.1 twitching motility protein PilT [Herbaspirillum sp. Sphag1AN]MBB3247715.1 twitching motility protein PilT [Herbaspirillum sp. Sphag64]
MDIPGLLSFSVKKQASDLHLSAGLPPMLRIHGDICKINLPALTAAALRSMLEAIMDTQQRTGWETTLECDFAFAVPALGRFRVNVFQQAHGPAAVIRTISDTIPSLTQLRAPPVLAELALRKQGLILITGPTGSGKSTTLAALIQHINQQRQAHILTIEDPIEFIHVADKCLINQRAVGSHTHSFTNALRAALREDPDVIMIGELRDLETVRLALSAAETGHLVLATLHTSSAAKSIDRLVDVFPGDEKDLVRSMLSESLSAVISQTLLRHASENCRLAAYEVLLGTSAIRNLIREGKVAQMTSVMQTSAAAGMQTMDQSLSELLREKLISIDSARAVARQPENLVP